MKKHIKALYFSPTQGTKKIVREIAQEIAQGMDATKDIIEYDITLPSNRESGMTFDQDDLVIVGVPVYAGRVPGFLVPFFEKIHGQRTWVVPVVSYGNRAYDDALLELKDLFEHNGFISLAAGAFVGEHSYSDAIASGRPNTGDLNFACNFGQMIAKKLSKELTPLGEVPGAYPYKPKKPGTLMAPITTEECNNCSICVRQCPMAAINQEDVRSVDSTLCIHCNACVKACPQGAKRFEDEQFQNIRQWLLENYRLSACQPEVFL